MKRLILTNGSSASGNLGVSRRPDFLISLTHQLVWRHSLSDAELTEFFGKRKKRQSRANWQDYQPNIASNPSAQWALDLSSCARALMPSNCGWIRVRTINCS
jgi:hypothetical protein